MPNRSFQDLLATKKLLIFDNDGVMYHFLPENDAVWTDAAAKVAMQFKPELTYAQAVQKTEHCYDTKGYGLLYLMEEYGVDIAAVHQAFHDAIDINVVTHDSTLPDLFARLETPTAMLTQGTLNWVMRTFTRTGLAPYFPREKIFAFEHVGHIRKSVSSKPFEHVLESCGVAASDAVMVEDSARNLSIPKHMGITTVLTTQGKPTAAVDCPHADFVFEDVHTLLRAAAANDQKK